MIYQISVNNPVTDYLNVGRDQIPYMWAHRVDFTVAEMAVMLVVVDQVYEVVKEGDGIPGDGCCDEVDVKFCGPATVDEIQEAINREKPIPAIGKGSDSYVVPAFDVTSTVEELVRRGFLVKTRKGYVISNR